MPPEESPQARFDRLKKQLQDSILRDYPNPERKGCPGAAVLRELAERPLDDAVEGDPHWHHVTHCSECYRDFLAFNADSRRRAKARRALIMWGTAGVAVAAVALILLFTTRRASVYPQRPQNAELAYRTQTVDIPSMTRSAADTSHSPPFVIQRGAVALTVQLPFGSPAGKYDFQLRRGQNKQAVATASSDAAIRNGTTAFTVKLDLSNLTPGMYEMYVRRVPWDWDYYPVEIRAD